MTPCHATGEQLITAHTGRPVFNLHTSFNSHSTQHQWLWQNPSEAIKNAPLLRVNHTSHLGAHTHLGWPPHQHENFFGYALSRVINHTRR